MTGPVNCFIISQLNGMAVDNERLMRTPDCKAELAEFPPAPAEGGAVGCPSGTVTLACGRGGGGGGGERF